MLQIQFGNATFQTLINSVYNAGYFHLCQLDTRLPGSVILDYESVVSYYPNWGNSYPYGTQAGLTITTLESPTSEIMYNGLRITIKTRVDLTPIGQVDVTHMSADVNMTMLGDFWWRNYHHSTELITLDPECMSIEMSLVSLTMSNNSIDKNWMQSIINDVYLPQLNYVFYYQYVIIFQMNSLVYKSPKVSYNSSYVLVNMDFEVPPQ
eukprot:gnl/Chilomastix_caulleri/1316.p1 GENE.gnl/Chilomastix_caulleri/1316~~gnl/Chilomastix_caulleri/1316.p1  ORF type:complete len:208 (+),score=21.88 gnl/Chilomastix_caulleri/1316:120-743(+)